MKKNTIKPINFHSAITVAAFIIIIAGLMAGESLINPILMAGFISIICSPAIKWLQSKKISQTFAVLIVLTGVTAVFLGFSEIIGSSLSSFSSNADEYEKNLSEMGVSTLEYVKSLGWNISVSKISNMFNVSKVMNVTASVLGQLGSFMGNALTIFFLVIFMLLELTSIQRKTNVILKNTTKYDYVNIIFGNIRHYLSIKTVTSLITGLLIWISLEILGLDYAIIWALIAFLLNYIPNIGSIVAAFPAVLFALIQLQFGGALWTSIIFVSVNMIVGNIIEPKMMGKGLGLSTYVVFVSLLFWGFILGTVGMFLSVPLTMAIKIMLSEHPNTKWIALYLGSDEEIETYAKNSNDET